MRADNSDLDRKLIASERQMARLQGSTAKLETGFRSTQLQTGRLGNQFASLAGQIAGVHPIVGNLAQVMGNFAVGGLVTVGILGATAIFATFYDVLTKGARAARKESDALTKTLVDQAKAAYNATVRGRELILMQKEFELQEIKKSSGLGVKSFLGSVLTGRVFMDVGEVTAQGKAIADATTAVEQAQKNLGKTWEDLNPPAKNITNAVNTLKFSYDQLRDAIAKTRMEAEKIGEDFWRNIANSMFETDQRIKEFFGPNLDPNHTPGPRLTDFGTTVTGISSTMGLTDAQKKQAEEMGILVEDTNKNAKNIQDAIWGAAAQSAGLIVNALNIGGGGRGSGIGGALGSVLGAGLTVGAGALTSGIWGIVGGIAGSLFGGLFDSHKKAVNSNTQALREMTAAIYNQPSGYRVEPGRYAATDIKEIGKAALKYSTRGGAPVLAGAR